MDKNFPFQNIEPSSIKYELTLPQVEFIVKYVLTHVNLQLNTNNNLPEYGGIELAQKITGWSKWTIYEKVSKKSIPYSKRGSKLFFSKTDLMQYLEDGRVKTVEETEAELNQYLKSKNKKY